jgi:signal peptidase I
VSPWVAVAAIALATCVLAVLLARHRCLVVRVVGSSMAPTLLPGDRVLVRRYRRAPAGVGDVLVFQEPGGQRAIKRVAAVAGDVVPDSVRPVTGGTDVVPPGMLVLLGDGIRSGDSRQWGFIPADRALGLMIRKLSASTLVHE